MTAGLRAEYDGHAVVLCGPDPSMRLTRLTEPADVLALAATLQAYGEQMQAIRLREVRR